MHSTNTHRNPPPSNSTIHSSSIMGSYPSNGLCSLDHPAHQTSTAALRPPRLAYAPRDASPIPIGADFATHWKKKQRGRPAALRASLPPTATSLRRSLPTPPPTAASPCPPYRHTRRRGRRRRARLLRDGPPPTSQAERSRPPLENAHACVRCRTMPADAAVDVAPSTSRTDLGAVSPGAASRRRISGLPISEAVAGRRRWALGREGEGEAAERCTGGSPVDLGAAGVGAATHRRISGREVLSAAAEVLAEKGRGRRRPPDASGQGRKLSGRC